MSLLSNGTDNTSCIYMHVTNQTHPDCSIVCTNGTLGSANTGSLSVYASDLKLNGVSVLDARSNANNDVFIRGGKVCLTCMSNIKAGIMFFSFCFSFFTLPLHAFVLFTDLFSPFYCMFSS